MAGGGGLLSRGAAGVGDLCVDGGELGEAGEELQLVHEEVEVCDVGAGIPAHGDAIGLLHDGVRGGLDVGVAENEAEE